MRICCKCGGLQSTEPMESFAGTPCTCIVGDPQPTIQQLTSQIAQLDALVAKQNEQLENIQVQRDQVLHLLQGGALTDEQVQASGGIGVLIEDRHTHHVASKIIRTALPVLCTDSTREAYEAALRFLGEKEPK